MHPPEYSAVKFCHGCGSWSYAVPRMCHGSCVHLACRSFRPWNWYQLKFKPANNEEKWPADHGGDYDDWTKESAGEERAPDHEEDIVTETARPKKKMKKVIRVIRRQSHKKKKRSGGGTLN